MTRQEFQEAMEEINKGMELSQFRVMSIFLLTILSGPMILALPMVILYLLEIWIAGITYTSMGMLIYVSLTLLVPMVFNFRVRSTLTIFFGENSNTAFRQ